MPYARGQKHGRAKLAEQQVLAIRRLHSTGLPQAEIARLFHVSPGVVNHIIAGRTWSWLQYDATTATSKES